MTDEEAERVRNILEVEVRARLLRATPQFEAGDLAFCDDMNWHYPKEYSEIADAVRKQYNFTRKREEELDDE